MSDREEKIQETLDRFKISRRAAEFFVDVYEVIKTIRDYSEEASDYDTASNINNLRGSLATMFLFSIMNFDMSFLDKRENVEKVVAITQDAIEAIDFLIDDELDNELDEDNE